MGRCGLFRRMPRPEPEKQKAMENVLKNIENHRVAPQRMQARWKVDYNGTEGNYSFTVTVHMLKDSALLFNLSKFSLPVGRLLVTPGKVAYYENIRRTAYEGDPEELSRRLGIPFDFDLLQSMLLGNVPAKVLEESQWEISPSGTDSSALRIHIQNHPLLKSLVLNPLFRVAQSDWQYENHSLDIRYPAYDDHGFPLLMEMNSPGQEIRIKWKKIRFPEHLDIPFHIPSGYQRVKPKQ